MYISFLNGSVYIYIYAHRIHQRRPREKEQQVLMYRYFESEQKRLSRLFAREEESNTFIEAKARLFLSHATARGRYTFNSIAPFFSCDATTPYHLRTITHLCTILFFRVSSLVRARDAKIIITLPPRKCKPMADCEMCIL